MKRKKDGRRKKERCKRLTYIIQCNKVPFKMSERPQQNTKAVHLLPVHDFSIHTTAQTGNVFPCSLCQELNLISVVFPGKVTLYVHHWTCIQTILSNHYTVIKIGINACHEMKLTNMSQSR